MIKSKDKMEDEIQTINKMFAKASKLNACFATENERDKFEKERIRDGISRFGSRVLGFFRNKTLKTPKELGTILYNLGMVSSVEEGIKVVPSLDKVVLTCRSRYILSRHRYSIHKVTRENEEKYRVVREIMDPDLPPEVLEDLATDY